MYNKSGRISANEINKFTYCPYQWYYERYYGASKLRELRTGRLKELGLTDEALGNFKKGLEYHQKYKSNRITDTAKFACIIFVILIVVYIIYNIFK